MRLSEDGEAYEVLRAAIIRRVCSVCLDQRDDGRCGLEGRLCAIEAHLPAILEAVLSVQSDRMDEYEDAIRDRVCTPCGQQDTTGRCRLRERGDCALDTYLYLVVEAVEEVLQSPRLHTN